MDTSMKDMIDERHDRNRHGGDVLIYIKDYKMTTQNYVTWKQLQSR